MEPSSLVAQGLLLALSLSPAQPSPHPPSSGLAFTVCLLLGCNATQQASSLLGTNRNDCHSLGPEAHRPAPCCSSVRPGKMPNEVTADKRNDRTLSHSAVTAPPGEPGLVCPCLGSTDPHPLCGVTARPRWTQACPHHLQPVLKRPSLGMGNPGLPAPEALPSCVRGHFRDQKSAGHQNPGLQATMLASSSPRNMRHSGSFSGSFYVITPRFSVSLS